MSNQYRCNSKHSVTRWAQNIVPKAQKVLWKSKFQPKLPCPRPNGSLFWGSAADYVWGSTRDCKHKRAKPAAASSPPVQILGDAEPPTLNQLTWNWSRISWSFSWFSFMHLISNSGAECCSPTSVVVLHCLTELASFRLPRSALAAWNMEQRRSQSVCAWVCVYMGAHFRPLLSSQIIKWTALSTCTHTCIYNVSTCDHISLKAKKHRFYSSLQSLPAVPHCHQWWQHCAPVHVP